MISIFHLIWIVPVSAIAGIVVAIGCILVDDCLWWASDKPDKKHYENFSVSAETSSLKKGRQE